MKTVSPPPRPVFDERQLRVLRRVLGDRFDEVVPRLKGVVRFSRGEPSAAAGRSRPSREPVYDLGLRHVWAADKLERQCRRVLKTLEEADPITREACSWGVLHGEFQSLGRLSDLASPSWVRGEKARTALEGLVSEIQTWRDAARTLARRPRGRQNRERKFLNKWVGTALRDAEIRLTTARKGRLAIVIKVVIRAAGLSLPRDIFRDLQDVCNRLQPNPPSPTSHRTGSVRITRSKK